MITQLISEKDIKEKVKELGQKIRADYAFKEVVLVGILKGSVFFLTDLARELDPALTTLDFMQVNSYIGTQSSGFINVTLDTSADLTDKHVILVEDIIDTGSTLDFLIDHMTAKNCASVKIATLLNKQKVDHISIEYTGFFIPKEFVVGYGLDFEDKYRNLKFVGVLKNEDE